VEALGICTDTLRLASTSAEWRGCRGCSVAKNYRGWPLRQRLELLAFDARLAGVPQELIEAIWEAIDGLPGTEVARQPAAVGSCMARNLVGSEEERGEDYSRLPLRQRLELLAFDARLAGVPL
jgi:hypothetical protein